MKRTKRILTGLAVLCALSGSAFALNTDDANLTIEERFSYLEEELQVLEAKEQDMFNEEEAKAQEAAQNLATLKEMRAQVAARVKKMDAEAKRSLLPDDMKALATQYKDQLKQIDEQIKQNQKVVTDWARMRSIRNTTMIK